MLPPDQGYYSILTALGAAATLVVSAAAAVGMCNTRKAKGPVQEKEPDWGGGGGSFAGSNSASTAGNSLGPAPVWNARSREGRRGGGVLAHYQNIGSREKARRAEDRELERVRQQQRQAPPPPVKPAAPQPKKEEGEEPKLEKDKDDNMVYRPACDDETLAMIKTSFGTTQGVRNLNSTPEHAPSRIDEEAEKEQDREKEKDKDKKRKKKSSRKGRKGHGGGSRKKESNKKRKKKKKKRRTRSTSTDSEEEEAEFQRGAGRPPPSPEVRRKPKAERPIDDTQTDAESKKSGKQAGKDQGSGSGEGVDPTQED